MHNAADELSLHNLGLMTRVVVAPRNPFCSMIEAGSQWGAILITYNSLSDFNRAHLVTLRHNFKCAGRDEVESFGVANSALNFVAWLEGANAGRCSCK